MTNKRDELLKLAEQIIKLSPKMRFVGIIDLHGHIVEGIMKKGKTRNLVVTDMHIGFEASLASNDIFLGKNTSVNEIISELYKIIDTTKPDSLILLGDIKSSIKSIYKN